jgi:hypothetical protein
MKIIATLFAKKDDTLVINLVSLGWAVTVHWNRVKYPNVCYVARVPKEGVPKDLRTAIPALLKEAWKGKKPSELVMKATTIEYKDDPCENGQCDCWRTE